MKQNGALTIFSARPRISPEAARIAADCWAAVDSTAFATIAEEHRDELPLGPAKYFNYEWYLPLNAQRALDLGLGSGPPRKVVDLGCGFGYFLLVARQLGHEAIGLDLDRSDRRIPMAGSSAPGRCYHRVCEVLRNTRMLHEIRRFVPLPSSLQGADVVVGFEVCFDDFFSPLPWRRAEWRYFLADVGAKLASNGQLLLSLNSSHGKSTVTASVARLFRETGAILKGRVAWWQHGVSGPVG